MDAVHTNVIKRNGEEVNFDLDKIVNAINAANKEVDRLHQLNDYQVQAIADNIAKQIEIMTHAIHVEDIQDMVETGIMEMRGYEVAQKYVRYRYKRELARKSNTTDNGILALIDHMNEEVNQENSNKNPVINSTQRDYMAGEVSKDLTKRMLLPKEIVEAHEQGIIHFHDSDYFAQREHNCDLVNLEDMLQNGTVISETMIEKPHSFFTACNVTTQIVAQVASNQYGGQSFTLSHIAPFVDVSRKKIREQVIEERKMCGEALDEEVISKITESRLRAEVKSGIQTIQYQLITLMTCNGQAPFVTMFMYLDEVPEGQTRDDLAMIIEEVLQQRIQGVKNEKGIWITPAFPKLIYVLDKDNITEDSKYWYLTELAAKCTAKRMVPDYISAKVMRELKMAMSIRAWAAGHFRHPRTASGIRMVQENITDDSIRVLSRSTWLMLLVPQRDTWIGSGRFSNPVWNCVTGHFDADMSVCSERYPMWHQSCGNMVHLRDSRRVRPSINYCSMDIQQSHLAMQDFARCACA